MSKAKNLLDGFNLQRTGLVSKRQVNKKIIQLKDNDKREWKEQNREWKTDDLTCMKLKLQKDERK